MENLLRKYIDKWQRRSPKQKWKTVYYIGSLLCEASGVTVFTTMQNYWYSYMPEVLSIIYTMIASYTMWYYFQNGEYFIGLQGTCAVGIVFACLTIHVKTLTSTRFKINSLLNFGGRYIYMDYDQMPKLQEVSRRMVNRLVKNSFHSDFGFFLNITIQFAIGLLGLVASTAIEIGAALIFNALVAIPYMIHVDLEELEIELDSNGFSIPAEARLRNVFMKIQDYETIVQGSIDLYYTRLFVGAYLFTYSISFSIFSQLLLGHPSGYGIAMGNYVLLLICCHLGEYAEHIKEKITSELYAMPWYRLPVRSQKLVCCAIHMIQNGGSLTIGPFSRLNMETATDLTKAIYRVTMLIYHTFNA